MYDTTDMYWETYADQTEEDNFELIGVSGDIEPVTVIEKQVAEFRRKYGSRCEIKLWKRTDNA